MTGTAMATMLANLVASDKSENMDPLLVIRGEEACNLARELAQLAGESIETAVTTAIRQRLEQERGKIARFQRFMQSTAESRASMSGSDISGTFL